MFDRSTPMPVLGQWPGPAIVIPTFVPPAAMPVDIDVGLLRQAFGRFAVSDAVWRHLAESAHLVRCGVGPLKLASPRRPEPAWWLVRQGRLSIGTSTAAGVFVEKRCIGPGEWLDVAGALSAPGTWLEPAICRTPVELLALPLPEILASCAQDTEFAHAFGAVLATRLRELNLQLDDIATVDVPVRFARWLLRRIDADADRQVVCLLLTERKQSIARQLCTTSETLSRTLRRLSDAGVIEVQDYRLTIHDLGALRMLAHPDGTGRRAPASTLRRGSSARTR